MKRRFPAALVLLALGASTLTGCLAFGDPLGRRTAFRDAQREYTKRVRWGDLEAAARFVHPDLRADYLGYEAEFSGIRITDFDVGEIDWGEALHSARVRVTYRAYSTASMSEVEIRETQQWERLGGNDWVVRPELDGIIDTVRDFRL